MKSQGFTPEERSVCRIVGTPIGNMSDLTPRALKALEVADVVFAEDTRTAKALMSSLNISKYIESYHKDNERLAVGRVLLALEKGKKVALISEAGMPGISDPGFLLIKELMEKQLPFEVIPGVSACVHAAVTSGLCKDGRYFFAGFFPSKNIESTIENYLNFNVPIVFYESPHRIKDTLRVLFDYFSAPIAVCRELTKLHEEVQWIYNQEDIYNIKAKGEFCIVTGAESKKEAGSSFSVDPQILAEELLSKGVSPKTASDILKSCGLKRNDAYNIVQSFLK